MRIGERIQQARKAAGLSQKELAERLGVTQTVIGNIERGERNPKIETIDRISVALGTSLHTVNDYRGLSEVDSFGGLIDMLGETYGYVEQKEFQLSDGNTIDYWVIGSGNEKFVIYHEDMFTLHDTVKKILPPVVELMGDTRAEDEIIKNPRKITVET